MRLTKKELVLFTYNSIIRKIKTNYIINYTVSDTCNILKTNEKLIERYDHIDVVIARKTIKIKIKDKYLYINKVWSGVK